MDAVDLVTVLRSMRRALDEHERRLSELERSPQLFSRDELDRQRRVAVLRARDRGLSIAMIAAALGVGRTTVATILGDEEVAGPVKVRGLDNKLHPARHHWGHRNGDHPQA